MKRGHDAWSAGIVAAVLIVVACGRHVQAQARNCPKIEDQLVVVEEGQPTAFRLRVTDLGDGHVGIFQFPLGGILEQTGPSDLDFVFLPSENFNGTTSFTYRVDTPVGCPDNVLLGTVTLAGGTAAGTSIGLAPEPACGVGVVGLAGPALIMCHVLRPRRRHRAGSA